MDKKRSEGKHYYVYTVAGSAKFLRVYYARVTEFLRSQPSPDACWWFLMNHYDDFQPTSCVVGLLKLPDAQLHPAIKFWWFFCSGYWHLLAGLRALWILSTCFPDLKTILQSGPSAFKFNLKRTVIFLLRKFSSLQSQQAGRVGTNSQFLNQIFQIRLQKYLLGFSQTRHSAQTCAECASYSPKALWPTRGLVPSSSLFFRQSFPCFFLQAAESNVFSKLFVDTARFLW